MNKYVKLLLMFIFGIVISYFMTFNVLINKYDFDNIYKMYASIYNALWIVFIELIIIIYAEKDYSGFLLVLMIIIMISAFTVRYMIQNATFFPCTFYSWRPKSRQPWCSQPVSSPSTHPPRKPER